MAPADRPDGSLLRARTEPAGSGAAGRRLRCPAVSGGLLRLVERLAFVGVAPGDGGDVRDRKVALTLAALTVTVLAVIWVATYLVLGLPVAAAIPFAYQVASVGSIVIFARTKDSRFFRASQLVLMMLLPFLLQLSLGGYVASSAVSAWRPNLQGLDERLGSGHGPADGPLMRWRLTWTDVGSV